MVVGGSVHWCLGPLISDAYKNFIINDNNNENISLSRSYPSVMVAPFEITNKWRYIALYLFETFGILSSGIGLSCCDILFVTILIHIRGHLLHEAYEDYSNGAMFAQCIENVVALCIVSLQVSILPFTTNLDSILELSSIIEYTIGIALELFVYCYLGTQIEELGLEVGDSLFSSNWEQFEIYKILTFTIMRTQEPILITGGPFYIMNLATFKNLVYLSISNSVVLRQLQIGN
ncbi:odorant receptor 9a-like [Aphidius gifuensis]|uniref:odorant receptor 9a-like n=1 Tax=Aphidius gifuensis TaxID=684658 RepID=UPI001CDBF2B4|nr:odorant receptor 9a-like [Aphidius gifuensis]